MRQYLAEGYSGSFPFLVDRAKPLVSESGVNGQNVWRIPGRFSECDKVNGNNRRYSRKVWEKNLAEGSTLQKLIAGNEAFGLLEHPADGKVDLRSDISHAVTKAVMQEDGTITGEITIIDCGENSPGRKLKSLIEFGYNPRVSSRGFGSLLRSTDGVDDVQEDYVCEGWDVVIKPSFETAQLSPSRKTDVATTPAKEKVELKVEDAKAGVKEDLEAKPQPKAEAETPSAPAPSAAAPAQTQQPVTESMTVNINETKARIATLKAQDTSKLSPAQFAEGVAQMADLHQTVANYVAEDGKRSWEGTKLHQEIEAIEKTWADAQEQPGKTAAKLREDRNKVLHVAKSLVETALKFKGALAEQIKSNAAQAKLVEELTTNGTGWMDLANKRKERLDFVTRKYQVACEALMLMAGRYKEDMTTVSRHALNLEFKAKLDAKPELQKALNEAKTPQEVLAIREQLADKPAETPAKPEEKKEETPAAHAQESKTAPAAAAPVTESKPTAAAPTAVVEETVRNPRAINEAAEMVKRLSLASAK